MQSFFRDADGRLAVTQWPNWPLWFTIGGYVVARTFESSGHIDIVGWFVFYVAGFYWAYLEAAKGDSLFRKTLGVAVLIWLLVALAARLVNIGS